MSEITVSATGPADSNNYYDNNLQQQQQQAVDCALNKQQVSHNGKQQQSPAGRAGDAGRDRSVSAVHGATLSFHNLNYFVKVPTPGRRLKCCSTVDKQILYNVSGIFRPGMNAIMGPTGSGKTTLLDVLAGRTEQTGIEGHILVDGRRRPKNFKLMTGYVVQDDVVMGTLTVRENLMFSANLRLPSTVSHAEKCQRVTETIEELGLDKCADSKVGTEFIRGVSGGERKRTNIGMELIISPPILFLDEPTTGLDASTSGAVMSLLARLSLRGRTIIFSIHQPRYAIFKLFTRLHLVVAGRTAYHGAPTETLEYFRSIGYECEEHNNPADFFLDVVNGNSAAARRVQDDDDDEEDDNDDDDEQQLRNASFAETLSHKYDSSIWFQRCAEEIDPIMTDHRHRTEQGTETHPPAADYATSFLAQLRYVGVRTAVNLLRSPQATILQLAMNVGLAVVLGLIFLRLDLTSPSIQSRQGLLFFVSINGMMSNTPAVEVFIQERAIFIHESASGFYRVSAYFVSKVLCDVIPMRVIPVIAFCLITYFMAGLQEDAGKFFIFFLDNFLVTLCAAAIAFAVSASIGVFTVANLITVLIYVLMTIFGGLLVNVAAIDSWIRWLQWLSLCRYSLNTLMINEFKGLKFSGGGLSILGTNETLGTSFLELQSIPYKTQWDLWQNQLALILMSLGIMGLAYIQLRRMKKCK